MNATKRKLNTLIQEIGARSPHSSNKDATDASVRDQATSHSPLGLPPSSPIATSSPFAELLNKRRRVGDHDMASPFPKTGKSTISLVGSKKWTLGTTTSTRQKTIPADTPKYCPSDRDELIKRLGTFQELTEWTPKPDLVNEIEWAKRGWVCQGKERVRCTLCHKELVVKTNTRTVDGQQVPVVVDSDVEQGLAKRFAELIIEAHDEDCLWRRHGCDDSLLRLSLTVTQSALASLRERYDDLCTRPSFLPYLFNLRLPPALDLETVKSQLPPTFFTQPPPPSTNPSSTNDVALALALVGWQGLTNSRIGAVPNSATCVTCLRRLGLWMFKSKEVDEKTGKIIVPAPMGYLDPVREHRFFCPWRNAAAQQNPGSKTKDTKAAWEVLAQTLKNSAYLRQQNESSTRRSILHRAAASLPGTPVRSRNQDGEEQATTEGTDAVENEEEDMAARDAKDKERWAKLRRVKSLFDTKGRRKNLRATSRPGTANSPPATTQSRQGSVDKPGEKA
ncbi:zf-C3HC-domain-containing protein [Xylaria nigripes]|nr:zf-C3HC-domain-containing protein [Xylaria nigripes]